MADPTILFTCRGDGRCPECGEGSAFPFRLLCGCSPCLSSACSLNHTRALLTEALRQRDYGPRIVATVAKDEIAKLREERDAAIRQVEEQRHPCPCGKDTASIKWARCYSCRQAYHAEMERAMAERDSAIRERDEARSEVRTLRLLVESQTEQVSQSAMDLYSAVQSEVAAEGRADRAEALLREIAAVPLVGLTLGSVLLAKIREALGD